LRESGFSVSNLWNARGGAVLTPQEFKRRWESVGDIPLVTFPERVFSNVAIPPEVRDFLVEIGLPADAAPFLSFAPPERRTLERVSDVWFQPATLDRYRIIGGNGSGDPICLDEESEGQVFYLNHDNDFAPVLMASSVLALAECLLEVRDFVEVAGGFEMLSVEQYDLLMGILESIDPASEGEEGFWREELRP
jgi:hypothetical protein